VKYTFYGFMPGTMKLMGSWMQDFLRKRGILHQNLGYETVPENLCSSHWFASVGLFIWAKTSKTTS
jgi:hypothetical protein